MRHKLLRSVLALLTFAITVQWSRVARAAPLTITGTVGEIGVFTVPNSNATYIRFKMTNVNTTAGCVDPQAIGYLGYAWFYGATNNAGDLDYREWFAELLYSKKGAPISCVVTNDANFGCHVTSCTLP